MSSSEINNETFLGRPIQSKTSFAKELKKRNN